MVDDLFLDWLSSRRGEARPFFAFLNYADAHSPYRISRKGLHRFGARPRNALEMDLINNWSVLNKQQLSAGELALARDAYDSCIAQIDEQVGRLFDRLADQGVLDRTWVIIASDHGESFGEHAGIFCHGTSLYQTELHVPLLVIPPAEGPSPRVVTREGESPGHRGDDRRPRGVSGALSFPGGVTEPVLAGSGRIQAGQHGRARYFPRGACRSGAQRSDGSGPRAGAQAAMAAGRPGCG